MADQPIEIVGNSTAPFIYFDAAPTFGVLGGAVQVELVAKTILPADASTRTEFVAAAHLRCSPAAANELIQALTKALLMLQPDGTPH